MADEELETSTSLVMSKDDTSQMTKTSKDLGNGTWVQGNSSTGTETPLSDAMLPCECVTKERALLDRAVSRRTRRRIYIVAVIVCVTLLAAIAVSLFLYFIERERHLQHPTSFDDTTQSSVSEERERQLQRHTSFDDTTQSSMSKEVCQENVQPLCKEMPYNMTGYPNALGHVNQTVAFEAGLSTLDVLGSECYEFLFDFWCALFAPPCIDGTVLQPCRDFCLDAKVKCDHIPDAEQLWPKACLDLPDSTDPNIICVPVPIPLTPIEQNLCRPTLFPRCNALGFQMTSSPHLLGHSNDWAEKGMEDVTRLDEAFHCYDLIGLFGCAALSPRCMKDDAQDDVRTIPPCRTLCEAAHRECGFFFELLNAGWALDYNCSSLPESLNEDVCSGGRQVEEHMKTPQSCSTDEVKCDGNRCIPNKWLCDGVRDCEDDFDESHCAMCGRDFLCDNSQCIGQSKVCDGVSDCSRGEDETDCVRLGGNMEAEGMLKVYSAETRTWNYICADGWNDKLSNHACLQILHRRANGTGRRRLRRAGNTRFMVYNDSLQFDASKRQTTSILQMLRKTHKCSSSLVIYLECSIRANDCNALLPWPFNEHQLAAGVDLPAGSWPWLVSIHGGPNRKFFCGATLLSSEWVMTAAHCIGSHLSTVGWTVTMGHTRRTAFNEFGQQRSIREIVIHPNFSRNDMEFDMALMRLDSPVKFDRYVAPLCLPPSGLRATRSHSCYVAGWGKPTAHAFHYRPVAQIRKVEIVDGNECRRAIQTAEPDVPIFVSDNTLCARGFCGMDACRGDSGGAMVCRVAVNDDGPPQWIAAGIVSWGVDCLSSNNVPGVYTDVNTARDWLAEVIGI